MITITWMGSETANLCGGAFVESLKDFIASQAEKLRNEESQAAQSAANGSPRSIA